MDNDYIHVQQTLRGNTVAFDELVKIYLPDVYRYLLWLAHDSDTAQDITQEAFIRAWKNLKKFDATKSFKPWLLRLARNAAYDHMRQKAVLPFSRLSEQEEYYVNQIQDTTLLPVEQTVNNERSAEVQTVLSQLSVKYREVLVLHYFEELAAPEIADVLNLSHETVRTRLRRARALFRKSFEQSGYETNPLTTLLNPAPQSRTAK